MQVGQYWIQRSEYKFLDQHNIDLKKYFFKWYVKSRGANKVDLRKKKELPLNIIPEEPIYESQQDIMSWLNNFQPNKR